MKLPTIDTSSRLKKVPKEEKIKRVRTLHHRVKELSGTVEKIESTLKKVRRRRSSG